MNIYIGISISKFKAMLRVKAEGWRLEHATFSKYDFSISGPASRWKHETFVSNRTNFPRFYSCLRIDFLLFSFIPSSFFAFLLRHDRCYTSHRIIYKWKVGRKKIWEKEKKINVHLNWTSKKKRNNKVQKITTIKKKKHRQIASKLFRPVFLHWRRNSM